MRSRALVMVIFLLTAPHASWASGFWCRAINVGCDRSAQAAEEYMRCLQWVQNQYDRYLEEALADEEVWIYEYNSITHYVRGRMKMAAGLCEADYIKALQRMQ